MLKARDWRQWRTRDRLLVFGPALVLAITACVVAINFVKPAPPRRIVLATGRPDDAYHQYGLRYQAELAHEGITVELRATSGALFRPPRTSSSPARQPARHNVDLRGHPLVS